MGVFERIDPENMMQELSRIFGADDRITGMIPDTEGDPSSAESYGGQYYKRQLAPVVNRRFPLVRQFSNYGRELLSPDGKKDGYTGILRAILSRAYRLPRTARCFPTDRSASPMGR